MIIVAIKPGHDGHIACLADGKLSYSFEAEKNSGPRYGEVTPSLLIDSFANTTDIPDAICISGWAEEGSDIGAGYFSLDTLQNEDISLFGKSAKYFSSSHERAHILLAYGMSPFPQGERVYVLSWEGYIGRFYLVDEHLNIQMLGEVLYAPGTRYGFLFGLADPDFSFSFGGIRLSDAGKLMALAAYGDDNECDEDEREIIDYLLQKELPLESIHKPDFSGSNFYNIGVESPKFKNLARKFSNALFGRVHSEVEKLVTEQLPLLITGGCGLNCDWNTAWKNSKLFKDVFVPPCPNDAGVAIGTAIDAQYHFTKNAKINWDVYSGQDFIDDGLVSTEFEESKLDHTFIAAKLINEGKVFGWIQGRCEIGPRALGNRSLLASPFDPETKTKLNLIKRRETYRPIAPICLLEDSPSLFDLKGESPFMLYFSRVLTELIPAVTHVDGSARVQTVTEKQNLSMHSLLKEVQKLAGYGVLCNTSLNFNSRGFINKMSDMVAYALAQDLDGFVVNDRMFIRRI